MLTIDKVEDLVNVSMTKSEIRLVGLLVRKHQQELLRDIDLFTPKKADERRTIWAKLENFKLNKITPLL